MSGQPAHLGEAMIPPGNSPRETIDENIWALQGELLKRLQAAQEMM